MRLYGVYDEDDVLISVHKTEEGANKNLKAYGQDGWYVDYVTVYE